MQAELQGNSKHHERAQWKDQSVGVTQAQMQSEYSGMPLYPYVAAYGVDRDYSSIAK